MNDSWTEGTGTVWILPGPRIPNHKARNTNSKGRNGKILTESDLEEVLSLSSRSVTYRIR
ncbi:hypothetical protein CBL_03620 [Carabus blaptoides fortunei]